MPDGSFLLLVALIILLLCSFLISAVISSYARWDHSSGWRTWGPGVLAWSWPLSIAGTVVTLNATESGWALWILLLIPLALLAATALAAMEFVRARRLHCGKAKRRQPA